jgi:hypothetical protein
MLKTFIFISLIVSLSSHANCIGEAQILGKIQKVEQTTSGCRVFLSSNAIINTSIVCPIDEGKLSSEGIEVGLIDGSNCKMEVGNVITGVVVDNGSFIYLE